MSIKEELQRERKKLLLLRSDAHIKHAIFNEDHSIGTKKDCQVCQIYNHILRSDQLILKKLQLIYEDQNLIAEYHQLRRQLGRLPVESEFKESGEVEERFGSWSNFLIKVKDQKEWPPN